jgi:hypothetical protein
MPMMTGRSPGGSCARKPMEQALRPDPTGRANHLLSRSVPHPVLHSVAPPPTARPTTSASPPSPASATRPARAWPRPPAPPGAAGPRPGRGRAAHGAPRARARGAAVRLRP